MNTLLPIFTNIRSQISDEFSRLHRQAIRDSLLAKLTGLNTKLMNPPKGNLSNRKLLGTKDIPVDKIVGALGRPDDFDHKFRPLKKYLQDRWVNTYVRLELDGWSPILVHKIGEDYYVEDGHHRVSVAKAIGIAFIEAKVWEYPVSVIEEVCCRTYECKEVRPRKAYASR